MLDCEHPHCTDANRRVLGKTHSYLCTKSKHYHNWHHHPHYKKIHYSILVIYILTIISLITSNLFIPTKIYAAPATTNWDMSSSDNYTFDNAKINFSSGSASLTRAHIPGTDWIATENTYDWNNRQTVFIDNTQTASTLTDYQTVLTLNTQALIIAGKMSSDCKDIRFTDSDKVTPLSFWLESDCNTIATKIWIKVPSIPASSSANIYLYYNNSHAASASNGDNTFIFFDDFNGNSLDTSKWIAVDPRNKFSESNGKLNFTYGSGSGNWDAGIYSKSNFNRSNISFEFNYKRTSIYSPYNAFMWGWKDTTSDVNYPSLVYGEYSQADGGCSVNCSNAIYEKGGGTGNITWQQALDYVVRVRLKPTAGAYFDQSIDGGVTWNTAYTSNQSNDSPMKIAWLHYSGDEVVDNAKIRQWTANEPTLSADSESFLYPTDNPTLTSSTGQGYSTLSGFAETLGSGSSGTIKFQISPDNGSTWYWWNGSAWVITSAGYTETNLSSDINSHIINFTAGSTPKTFKWKAYFNSNGSQQPKIDNITLSYIWDTGLPNNVSTFTSVKSQSSAGINLSVSDGSRWYNYPNPYFTWADPGDTSNEGETISGMGNYYICFNTDNTCHPATGGSQQSSTTYTANNLVSGSTYYFRVRTRDNAGNYSSGENQLFTYKYDADKPTNPHYVTVTPSGYSNNKQFSFVWPTANSAAASDTGGSNVLGYQYKINNDPNWYGLDHTGASDDIIPVGTGTLALPAEDDDLVVEGANTFYLRTIDNAGNIASNTVQVPFYFNNSAPTAPTGLSVNPKTNTTNNFSFTWNSPLSYTGEIDKYYYSVNSFPNAGSNNTTQTSLNNQSAATTQGENTFYIVAQDKAGNVNFDSCQNIQNNPQTDGCTKVSFTANTPAPGMPTNLIVNDQSIRDVAYKVSLAWDAPIDTGVGVNHYNVYRKTNTNTWAVIVERSKDDTDYTDNAVQAGTQYYYKINAVDSAGKESADSTIISIKPKGEYKSPASITENSIKVAVTSRTAEIQWQTDPTKDAYGEVHSTNSMVAYGKTEKLGAASTDDELVSDHSITLTNLDPDTIYYYRISGMDIGNKNQTLGNILTFQTAKPTVISKVEVLEIRQTTAILKWQTSRITTTELNYGQTTSYGSTYKESDIPTATSHTVFLQNLEPGTQYHFQIQGKDEFGDIIKSDNYELLKTMEFPKVTDITFQPLKNEPTTTVEIDWSTNIPTDGRVKYATTNESDWREEYDGDFKTVHKFTIGDGKLLDQKTYLFKAFVRDQYGNEATSENQTYTTPEDTRPPVITNLQSEVSIDGAGDTAKVSAIITWDTDEPSDSQVFYGAGTAGDMPNSTGKDTTLVTSHLVVISDLKPAQTYHVQAKSSDKAGNLSQSNTQNFVTNQASQSVINIILTRLQQTFGWMTSINGLFGGK